MVQRKFLVGTLAALLLVLSGCSLFSSTPKAPPPDKLILDRVTFQQMRGWDADAHAESLATFINSCDGFALMEDQDAVGRGELLAPVAMWKGLCRKARSVPAGDAPLARQFFETYFVPYHVSNNGNPRGLMTGYYQPLLLGSRTQKAPFIYPVYAMPNGDPTLLSRSEIDQGGLQGRANIIAYVDDPVMLFFLQVQGSGRIQLEDKSIVYVAYAGTNGKPYVAIGKVLADKGILEREKITMPSLRQWLYDHPNEMWATMWENPHYVFFRESKWDARGAQGVPLTPGRSLAVDMQYIPLGTPVFVDTMMPDTPSGPFVVQRKLFIAQDTGGAIRGPVRGDVYFGFGVSAEQLAGRMRQGGEFTILVPRPLAIHIKKREE